MRALNYRITRAGLSFRHSAFKSRDGMKHKAKTQKKEYKATKVRLNMQPSEKIQTKVGIHSGDIALLVLVGLHAPLMGTEGLQGPGSHQGHVRPPSVVCERIISLRRR